MVNIILVQFQCILHFPSCIPALDSSVKLEQYKLEIRLFDLIFESRFPISNNEKYLMFSCIECYFPRTLNTFLFLNQY